MKLELKLKIINYRLDGWSITHTANLCGVSVSTVNRVWKDYKETLKEFGL